MPTGPRKPSILREPRSRLKLEWHRLRKRTEELKMRWGYKFMSKTRPRPKIGLRRVGPTAQALYRQMYTAFAE